tara:strand:- start:1419 stop:1676 length:258 start_codon:yes stop_codon:yes gene_type:complete
MKDLNTIIEGFRMFSVQKVELNNDVDTKYYMTDLKECPIKSLEEGKNYVGYITRYKWDVEQSEKWYTCEIKFHAAINRICNMQTK